MFDGPYTHDVLALASDIPHLGALDAPDGAATKRSMVCGSEVGVELRLDTDGRIAALGLSVEACALGQASASVFARGAIGASLEEIITARAALEAMLSDGGPPPEGRFAGLGALAGVKAYPRRHASTLLAFRAGEAAMRAALGEDDQPDQGERT